jgi:hypothetical protein
MKPGDFALRSKESRAAARLILDQRTQKRDHLELILGYNAFELEKPRATPWEDSSDGKRQVRIVSIPEGMTIAAALGVIGGCSAKELEIIAEKYSEPVVSGLLAELRR